MDYHATDPIKFRGVNLSDGLDNDMLRMSSACLAGEIGLLQPSAVVFTNKSAGALRTLRNQGEFDVIREQLINHPRQATVPFWKYDAFAEWQTAIRRLTE